MSDIVFGSGITIGTGISVLPPTPLGNKAIFGYGITFSPTTTLYSMTNIVSNTGVVATDTTGVGTARSDLAAAAYG